VEKGRSLKFDKTTKTEVNFELTSKTEVTRQKLK